MSDLIDALQTVDRSLMRSIDTAIEPVLMLEDIETGSIKAWLRQAINSVDDEGLKKGDWKMVVGANTWLSTFSIKKWTLKAPKKLRSLTSNTKSAEETDVRRFSTYEPPSREKLVYDIVKINDALEPLNDGDRAEFISKVGNADFNLSLHIAPETIQDLIRSEMIQSVSEMILKVKKPDF